MAGPFVEQFRRIVEPLFGHSFTAAYGIPDADLDAVPGRHGYGLPQVLQDFYSIFGRFEPILSTHNRFYPPGALSRMDGKLVFCEENQVVVYWGYDEDQGWQTDPPVYQGVNNAEVEWNVESDRMSYFLTGMIYWQALYGGLPEFRSGKAPDTIREAAAFWPLVWQNETTQLFSRGPFVISLTGRVGSIRFMAAGPSEAGLAELCGRC